MGYLIQPGSDLIKTSVIIPEADVLQLHVTPYNLIPLVNFNQFVLLKNAYLRAADNQIQNYSGFQHIYLQDDSPAVISFYQEQSPIAPIYLFYFNIGASHPPSRFGSQIKTGYGVNLSFSNAPIQGDGDIIVYLEYNILTV